MRLSDDIRDFDYVAVEVVENPGLNVSQIECGLFMGILSHDSGTDKEAHFLALQTTDASVRLYNMSEFNVLSIDALNADMNYLTVFRNTAKDQDEAADILRAIVKEMSKNNRLFDTTPHCELIDVDSYTNVPEHILSSNTLSGNPASTGTKTKKHNNIRPISTHTPYVHKEPAKPTVLNFRRKGKLPEQAKLDKMKAMVMAIASGELGEIKLPVPKCDVVEEQPKEEATKTSV